MIQGRKQRIHHEKIALSLTILLGALSASNATAFDGDVNAGKENQQRVRLVTAQTVMRRLTSTQKLQANTQITYTNNLLNLN